MGGPGNQCARGLRVRDVDGSCRRKCSDPNHYIDSDWNCVATCQSPNTFKFGVTPIRGVYKAMITISDADYNKVSVKACVKSCPSKIYNL
jgi:hypothetical protein